MQTRTKFKFLSLRRRVSAGERRLAGILAVFIFMICSVFTDTHAIELLFSFPQPERLNGHSALVTTAVFSPDGARIVSGSYDNTLKLWDTVSGTELITFKGHTNAIYAAAFSPDGARIVSGSGDNTLKLWDTATGAELMTLNGHTDDVFTAAFSPDGMRIVSGQNCFWEPSSQSKMDCNLKLWDAATGAELMTLNGHTDSVVTAAFSPDGMRIVSVQNCSWDFSSQSYTDCNLKLWDAATGAELMTLRGHTSHVKAAAFSPDSTRIVSGSSDTALKLWDAATGAELMTLNGHTFGVNTTAFSPDGARIVSGGKYGLKVWDAAMGAELITLAGDRYDVNTAAFSPDGTRIVFGFGRRGGLKVWDAATGAELKTLGHDAPDYDYYSALWTMPVSPDGARTISFENYDYNMFDNTLKVWDTVSGAELMTLKGHTEQIAAAAFSPDGARIVSVERGTCYSYERCNLILWDAATGVKLMTVSGARKPIAFSPDGTRIVSGGYERNTLKLWDAATGAELMTLSGGAWFNAAAFSPDGTRIVSGGGDGFKVWDAATGAELLTFGSSQDERMVSISSNGMRIASLASLEPPDLMKVWDAATGAELLTLDIGPNDYDSRYYEDCYDYIPIYLPNSAGVIYTGPPMIMYYEGLDCMIMYDEPFYTLFFSPDGTRILSISDDFPEPILWDATTGAKLLIPNIDAGRLTSIALSRSGRYIYSYDNESAVKVWDSSINPSLALPTEFSVPDGSVAQITPLSGEPRFWSSADNAIASVDAGGAVTAIAPGNVNITARDADGMPQTLTVHVTADNAAASFGRAIVIAGGGAHSSLFPYSNELAGRMYGLLKSKGFADSEIYYFNPEALQDINGDGLDDGIADYALHDPWNELNAAMDEIAPALLPGQQLVFYLHGYADNSGGAPALRLNETAEISAAQLAQLLARAPEHAQQVIILDTCYSGAFLESLTGHPRRIVLTGADADIKAWNPRRENFSNVFINSARRGMNLYDSFLEAVRIIKNNPDQFAGQRPLMDDDGDGFYNSMREGVNAARTWLGSPGASAPPEITAIHPPLQAGADSGVLLWAEPSLPGSDSIRKVRAVLSRAADSQYETALYQGGTTDYSRIELELYHNAGQNRWETQFASFPKAGLWHVMYEAQDMDGAWSLPATGEAEVSNVPGNLLPLAGFSINPEIADVSQPVMLDASASADPDGAIDGYRWSIAGNVFTEKNVTLAFANSGEYAIELTVTDNTGAKDTLTGAIIVNSPPLAEFRMVPSPAEMSRPVTFNASASTDPDGIVSGYRWLIAGNEHTGENVTFAFADLGEYIVELTVTDNLGAENTLTRVITVNDPPRAAFRMDPDPAEASHPAVFDASASVYAGGAISGYRWLIAGNEYTGANVTLAFTGAGDYPVELEVTDDLGARGTVSGVASVLPAKPGRALLIAGGGTPENGALFPYSDEFVQRMYRLLLEHGFSDEDILYINSAAPDIDLDGVPEPERLDFGLSDPEAELNAAFAEAAARLYAGHQFVFYFHGHARPGYLDISPPYELSVQRLRELLDTQSPSVEQIVILDAGYSGSFIAGLAAPGRIVISGTNDPVWNVEYLSFSDKFINALRRGNSLGLAFNLATQQMQNPVNAPWFTRQTPWLDDDGDGLPNAGDGETANRLYLGHEAPTEADPPEIIQVHPPETLDGRVTAFLWVKTNPSADAIRSVRAILLGPNLRAREYLGRETAFVRLETELAYNPGLDRYVSEHAFCTGGDWEIRYQAQDSGGVWSETKSGYLVQSPDVSSPLCDTAMSLKILVNPRYTAGDVFRMALETDGAGEAIPYAGVILPNGDYFTYRYNADFSFMNTPEPFLALLPVNGKTVWPVTEFVLQEGVPAGNYQACGMLIRPDAEDALNIADWLDWDCAKMELY
ncbi:MAG: hypothetical protein GY862_16230 [Gammaproteobacteria bacterium]|nr:hypothetical protein [Gammaproteobacteria bacterium]